MLKTLKGLREGVTVHGFRSTFRTWAEDRTSFPEAVLEQALAHKVGSHGDKRDPKVIEAYRRTNVLEKRRKLMQQWSDYCASPPVAAEVTPLRRKALS